MTPLVPTLIVGGEHSFIVDKLSPQLLRHGLQTATHWEWRRKAGAFPDTTKLVFVLTDMVGHVLNNAAVLQARERGLPVIMGCRKWAMNVDRLEKAGFPLLLSPTPIPVLPQPKETSVSQHQLDNLYAVYETVMRDMHHLSGDEIYAEVKSRCAGLGLNPGAKRPDLMSRVRKALGVQNPNMAISRPRASKKAAPVVAPVVATVPTSEVPPEVLAATPANVQPRKPIPQAREGVTEIKDLVKLLRIVMAEENLTHLSVHPDGVTFRRVVVEEGMFDV